MDNPEDNNRDRDPTDSGQKYHRPHTMEFLFDRVEHIQVEHPDVVEKMDRLDQDIRRSLNHLKDQISRLKKEDQELVTILTMESIHNAVEKILLDSSSSDSSS